MPEQPVKVALQAAPKAVASDPGSSGNEGLITTIARPPAGTYAVSEIAPGSKVAFAFALDDAKIVALDVDLVLMFPDGAKIILPNYAFELVSGEASEVAFRDKEMDAQTFFASIADVKLATDGSLQTTGGEVERKADAAADKKADEEAPVQPPPIPPAPHDSTLKGVADFDKKNDDQSTLSLFKQPDAATPQASGSPPKSDNKGTSFGNVTAAVLEIELLGVSKSRATSLASGGQLVYGAAAVPAATTDSAFATQQQRTSISGTSGDDVIYAVDPERMPSGTFERLIDIKATLPGLAGAAGATANTATISGLPTGFAVNNATHVGDSWIIQLDHADPNHLQVELRYVLPAQGAMPDENGFLGSFSLNILFDATDAAGAKTLYSGNQTFVLRDVQSADDVVTQLSGSDAKLYALNAVPPGAIVSAGAGDDVVYAGPGHDTIDGGAGRNTISYAMSSSGVTVDLQAGVGHGGYAEGDALTNFQNIEGSAYADKLTGSSGDNVFIASAGADAMIGGGGNDTVDYSKSAAGVTVDLVSGVGSGGLAAGDTLSGIGNLIGSATGANVLKGTSGANVLTGGAAADTIDGRGGADVIATGAGDDAVSYYASEVSIDGGAGADTLVMLGAADVDLNATDQTIGDAVQVGGFENVNASALTTGVTITGTDAANTITGGAGADVIHGGGGLDVIAAGGGDDQVDYHGAEASIDGGAGVNTLVMFAQASVNLANADQTSGDAVNVTKFQNVDASALSAAQAITIVGTGAANALTGGAGDDTIDGGGGADTIRGGAGADAITYRGSEVLIDGETGQNRLVMKVAANVDLQQADQTTGDATIVRGFVDVDASALTSGVSIKGSNAANVISGGAGDDTIDGAGGADVIAAGAGDDVVQVHGSEVSVDGGAGSDRMVFASGVTLTAIDLSVAAGLDQTQGDTQKITNFENVDAGAVTSSLRVTGSALANTILTGSGDDIIDGGGGADVISAGAGDDTIVFRGSELSIDGGAGANSLVLRAAANINLNNPDQTIGDVALVSNFVNIDGSSLSATQAITVVGTAGANVISGGAGADTIDGGGGADTLSGGAGDDRMSYWGSEISIDGGAGVNTLVLRAATNVDLVAADQTLGDSTGVSNFRNIDGSAISTGMTLSGSSAANVITGGSGTDIVDGRGGADVIATGDGADAVTYHGTELSIDGGAGVDTLVLAASGGMTSINLAAAPGVDQTVGDALAVTNFENLDGSSLSSALTVVGSAGDNRILTGSGADIVHGGGGADVIATGAGDDVVDYWGSEASIDGGAGVNTLIMKGAATVDLALADQTIGDGAAVSNFQNIDASALSTGVSLSGASGANRIIGSSGADVIDGRGGADVVQAGSGDDSIAYYGTETSLDGGAGSDTLVVASASGLTSVNLAAASGVDQTTGDSVVVTNVESLDATALTSSIAVTGSATANVIRTGAGADTVDGGGGADVIATGDGDDIVHYRGAEISIDGGAGVNTLLMDAASDVNLSRADQTIGDPTLVSNFQNVDAHTLGATQGVSIIGSSGANSIIGGAGADTIDGAGGADAISAGAGDDRVAYRGAETSIDGGAGVNTLALMTAANIDLSQADQTLSDATLVSGFNNVDATALGVTQAVTIKGSSAANIILGGAGADTIDGGGGADIISAGAGNDTVAYRGTETSIDGGSGSNTLVLKTSGGLTRVDLSVAAGDDETIGDAVAVTGFQNVDASILSSSQGIVVTGSTSANTISTGAGADTVHGGGGADVIATAGGDDIVDYWGSELSIDGGAGANTLVLKAATQVDLSQTDQTITDAVAVAGFSNIDASALLANVRLTGDANANVITAGAGADIIDGGGGADRIAAGAGDDLVTLRGQEVSVDGGAGSDTLVLAATSGVTTVNLSLTGGADQTTGDAPIVTGFENIDASALSTSLTITGSAQANVIVGGSAAEVIHGGGGADTITAGAGDDLVDAWGTEDSIDGGAGANTLVLRASSTIDLSNVADQSSGDLARIINFQNVDASGLTSFQSASITGSSDANVITGGAGADTIDGDGGADTIAGGAGADTIVYHGAEVSIDGGAGSDTLVLDTGAIVTAVDFSVAAGADQTSGDAVTVTRFENLDATRLGAALSVTGSSGANVIATGAGDDVIVGGGGADVISAGGGADSITYFGAETSIDGGSGIDTLVLRAAANVGLANTDQTTGDLTNTTNFENVDASALTVGVSIAGSAGVNVLKGGAGADAIDGGGGADVIDAGAGDDSVAYRGEEVSIDGGAGANTLLLKAGVVVDLGATDQTLGDNTNVARFQNVDASALTAAQTANITGSSVANVITGGAGADVIDGAGGADSIAAGAGDDVVSYHGAEVSIDGGGGSNTLVMRAFGGVTRVDLTVAPGADQTTGDGVVVANFQNVDASIFASTQNLTVIGSASQNVITTGAGADVIRGGGGADTIVAGAGDDTVDYWGTEVSIDGGAGVNTLVLKAAADINLTNPDQTALDPTQVTNFQNVDASALSTGVSIVGSSGVNLLTGGAGADTIDGGGGADTILGGGGDDRIVERGSEISLDGGAGSDTLVLMSGSGATSVNLAAAAGADQTGGDNVKASNFEGVDASAMAGALLVTGSAGANSIVTGAGDDIVRGGGGGDAIATGAGNDTVDYWGTEASIDGGADTNTLVLKAAVTLDLAAVDQSSGDITIVSHFQNVDGSGLTAIQAMAVTGDAGANVILGGAGADVLDGGGGADTIQAGAGADTVTYHGGEATVDGGAGSDTLVFAASGGVTAIDLSVAAGADQTAGDGGQVTNFESIDASVLTSALAVTGSAGVNVITTGAGADVIDGGGGADTIRAGGGDDQVFYRGGEALIDGGTGVNTLILKAATDVNLGRADQTIGDAALVSGFQNVDASALGPTQGVSLVGASGANVIKGGAGADTIDGGGGADTISAGGGDDTVSYRGGEVSIDGGAGSNTLVLRAAVNVDLSAADQTLADLVGVTGFQNVDASAISTGVSLAGTTGVNAITGGTGADTIDGGGGADSISAGAGDDIVTYHGAEVLVDGGAGVDTLTITSAAGLTAVDFSLAPGLDQTSGDAAFVGGFENLDAHALSSNLTVRGSSSANALQTGSGADVIDGGGGADVIDAGAGDDRVAYYGSEVSLTGGAGVNTLVLKSGATLDLNAADESLGDSTQTTGFQNVDGSGLSASQAVVVTGTSGANQLSGGAGADTIDGGGGADVIAAGAGDDSVVYHGAETSIAGGAGSDTLRLAAGGGVTSINFAVASGVDQTSGDSVLVTDFENVDAGVLTSALSVTGSSSANRIVTGSGDDVIRGGGGADVILAGVGDDRVDFWGSESTVDGGGGTNTLVLQAAAIISLALADQSVGDTSVVSAFQNVDASALSAIQSATLTGSSTANTLTGGAGADDIAAGAGDDRVTYRGQETSVDGGAGTDTLVVVAATGLTSVNLAVGPGYDQTTGDLVTVTNFENVDAGALSSAISIQGSSAANLIVGGSGADVIDGGGGADTIRAGAGNDRVLYYGAEASIDGGADANMLVLKASGGVTSIDLGASAGADQTIGDNVVVTNFTDLDASVLLASQGVTVTGSTGANTITTGAGSDTIDGRGGADVIAAGAGADTVAYHATEVSIDGGAGADTLVIAAGAAPTAIDLTVAAGADQTSGDGVLVTNFEGVDASASTSGVTLTGTSGANVLITGSGADIVDGGGGADTIATNGGDDTVSYYGSEVSIDGGAGVNTLLMKAAATVDLAAADQTIGDAPIVSGFQNVDASALSTGLSISGSSAANLLTGGSGADVIDGRGGADTIQAGAGDDRVSYRGGEVSIDGGAGADTLVVAGGSAITGVDLSVVAGADQTLGDAVTVINFENVDASAISRGLAIAGSAGANVIAGGAGADVIDGSGGADQIAAGAGADSVVYNGGEVSIDGGAGTDTLLLKSAVTVNLGNADQTNGDAVFVQGFENVDASTLSSALSITGSAAANVITGGAGADTIDGGGGADQISAGAGDDNVAYYGSETSIAGGAGLNTLVLKTAAAIDLSAIDQSVGDATVVTGFSGIDASALSTSANLKGTSGVNILIGGSGADVIDGAGGADTISAGAGDDLVTYRGGEVSIDGGAGSDTLALAVTSGVTAIDFTVAAGVDQTSGDGVNVLGFENIDAHLLTTAITVTGTVAANAIQTGSGNDVVHGGGGADVISTGAGADIVDYWGTEVSIDGGAGVNSLVLKAATSVDLSATDQTTTDLTQVSGFQNVDASALATGVALRGSAAANVIVGGAGDDTIDGLGGADTITAGAGADTVTVRGSETSVDGGAGSDTLVLAATAGVTSVNFALPAGNDQTGGDLVTVTGFENLDASAVATSLLVVGSSAASTIITGAGDDTIDGGGGADVISAGAGADSVAYWGSEVSIDGGAGANTLVMRATSTVDLNAADQTIGDTVAVAFFQNVDASGLTNAVRIGGSSAANRLTGGSGADIIDGAGGADVIVAGAGADTVTYRGGETSIDGGSGSDTLTLAGAVGLTAINFALPAGVDQTIGDAPLVTGFENLDASAISVGLTVTGSALANTLVTGAGADVIHGGGGADVIDAGAGDDFVDYYGFEVSIDGGAGSNTLVLKAAATINLGAPDQTSADLDVVVNFQNVDGSALSASQAVSVIGTTGANVLSTGAGADTIDGGGGADAIAAGAGNDVVTYHGGETSIDGGAGADLLVLAASGGVTAIDLSVAAGADQTSGDAVAVSNFESVDASVMTTAISVTGSTGANTITTGSGVDTIDGGGGADVINAGDGDDTVAYRGGETSIAGGAGVNSLVLKAATNVDLTRADQTVGDTPLVSGFRIVDASALTAGVSITGDSAANRISGGAGADTIDGNGGADVIAAGGGDDIVTYRGAEASIDGGAGVNTLVLASAVQVDLSAADQTIGDPTATTGFLNVDASALSSALTIAGSSAANRITGGSGDDTIDGGGGADVILAGAGADTVTSSGAELSIDGGAGSDTLVLKASTTVSAVDFSVAAGVDQTSGDNVAITRFENLDASAVAQALTVTGSSDANVIKTGAGADVIHGGGGADQISAGGGDDTVDYLGAESSIDGGADANTLVLKTAATVDLSNAGDQTLGDVVTVTQFQNVDATALSSGVSIKGSSVANILLGGAGADVIDGKGGADTIAAGAGDDNVTMRGAEVSIDAGAGVDLLTITAAPGLTAVDLSITGSGDQTIGDTPLVSGFESVDASALTSSLTVTGSSSANRISTGSGADVIHGAGGADVISAGAGADSVDYWASESSIDGGADVNTLVLRAAATVNLTQADQTSGDTTTVTNFQNVDASVLSAAQGATIVGDSGVNTITGGAGADTIDGGGGVDVIAAGAGADSVTFRGAETSIDGGTGLDTLVLAVSGGITAVNFAVAAGADQTLGDTVTVSNFENLDARALSSALTVTGSSGVNVINTGSGADIIDGGGGADTISSGAGDDVVTYRGSETSIDGGLGVNTLKLQAAVTVALANADQTSGDVGNVSNFQNVDASALSAGVSITGSSVANVLTGGAGDDTIDGFGGADTIAGGGGNDTIAYRGGEVSIDGGSGANTLVLKSAATVDLGLADQTTGDSVTVTKFVNIDASAIASALTLKGSSVANSIIGGSGADTIDGAGGADVISAGGGADVVTYHGGENSIDGGAGSNTLILAASGGVTQIDFSVAAGLDQTTGDTVAVSNFQNVDASILGAAQALRVIGSSAINAITTGAGADIVDGGGGADTIATGLGDDTVSVYGTESTVDAGSGVNTLVMKAATYTVNLANADQTGGDAAVVSGFQNVDASGLSAAVTILGSSLANTIKGGAGVDTLDGAGGADVIQAGAGDDIVAYHGGENSIDGGAGAGDMLVMSASGGVTAIDLGAAANADQTTGDAVNVTNFESVDASALASALIVSGGAGVNKITTGSGADIVHGGGGADVISTGAGDDIVDVWGTESSIAGGLGSNTLVLRAAVNVALANADQTSGDAAAVSGFINVDASLLLTGVSITGTSAANALTGGAGADVIDGAGGADAISAGSGADTVTQRGSETSIDGGAGVDTLVLLAGTAATAVDFTQTGGVDQTTGDGVLVTQFENLNATAVTTALNVKIGAAGGSIVTGSGADAITGSSVADTIDAGAGDDTIDGAGGADAILGGGGDDTIRYWGTETSIDGGVGANTLVMKAAATVNLANADQTTGDATLVSSFANVDASALSANLSITGSSGANRITGGAGADTIDGGGGADVISAGLGDDSVTYRGVESSIDGGGGVNTLVLRAATTVNLTLGDQTAGDSVTVTNFQNIDASALTSAQSVTLTGSAGANQITGGAGADTIDGGGGADKLDAGAGNDTVTYRGGETSIDGGAGTDMLLVAAGASLTAINLSVAAGVDQATGATTPIANFESIDAGVLATALTVTGSVGANTIVTGSGADVIDGLGGADVISAGTGDDTVSTYGGETSIDGGTGVNTLVVRATAGLASVDFSLGAGIDQTSGDTAAITGFQNLNASAISTALTVKGSTGVNLITAGAGADTIDGNGGFDEIDAGAGADTVTYRGVEKSIDGGTGSDKLILAASGGITAVDFTVTAGVDQTIGDAVSIANFESLDASILTTAVTVTATNAANAITTGSGADVIDAGGGADVINAGAGDDIVSFYGSETSIAGGAGVNTLLMKAAGTVNLASANQMTSGAALVTGFQNVDASGLATGVSITGSSAVNILTGGAGADVIDGAGGADTVSGGGGSDTIYYNASEFSIDGGTGTNTLVLKAAATVNLSLADQTVSDTVQTTNFQNVNASLLSVGVTLTGSSVANAIVGGNGDDIIDGGGGLDVISAGNGDDRVTYRGVESAIGGDAGTDTLVMLASGGTTAIDLTTAGDQTTGDAVTVSGFENVDASALSTALTVTGSSGVNTITTGGGNDTINGGGGADTITAGDGDDRVTYTGTEVLVDGGTGVNTLVLNIASGGVFLNLSNQSGGNQLFGRSGTIRNFQNVDGSGLSSDNAVIVSGGAGANRIATGAGDDTIHGGGGVDVISAGAGDDAVDYNATEQSIDGGLGVNTLVMKAASNVDLTATDQTVGDLVNVSGFQNVDASGASSSLSILGSAGANAITGGSVDDVIDGRGGSDVIDAGAGADTVTMRGSEVSIDGGAGADKLVIVSGVTLTAVNFSVAAGADQTTGDAVTVKNFESIDASVITNALTITGSSGANVIVSGSGADVIHGGGGADQISAGAGNDSVDYNGTETSIDGGSGVNTLVMIASGSVDLAASDQTVGDLVNVSSFQNVDASALSSAVSILGSASANTITGGAGDDVIDGRGGADVVDAGGGSDIVTLRGVETSIDGGSGQDKFIVAAGVTLSAVDFSVAAGADQTSGDAVSVRNFESLDASALSNALTITGSTGANTIVTGSGADAIDGHGGADAISAGGGADSVAYWGSEQSIDGGAGSDTLVLHAAATVDLSAADQTTDATTVTGFENVDASLLSSGVVLTGSSSANTLTGGSGDDTIHGGGGTDVIFAGGGDDIVDYNGTETSIDGGFGSDTLKLYVASAIDLSATDQTFGGANVSGFENVDASAVTSGLSITGSAGNNIIIGSSGDDVITSGGGIDHLSGGAGNDSFFLDGASLSLGARVDGGLGSNSVTFSAGSGTVTDSDLLTSLTHVQTIDFTQAGTDADLTLSAAQISQLAGGAAETLTLKFNDAADHLTLTDSSANYDVATGVGTTTYTFYDDTHTNITAHLTLVA
jgi:Ca2+-binding RTX toxin-like protein